MQVTHSKISLVISSDAGGGGLFLFLWWTSRMNYWSGTGLSASRDGVHIWLLEWNRPHVYLNDQFVFLGDTSVYGGGGEIEVWEIS